MPNKVCTCGKGYVSRWDNQCGKCRTNRQNKQHSYILSHDYLWVGVDMNDEQAVLAHYKELRRTLK